MYKTMEVSKQAVHQAKQRQLAFDHEVAQLIPQVERIRKEHPGCGLEKMYLDLQPKTMGRDAFCNVFMELGYGVKPARNYHRTTFRGDYFYPNLIEGMEVNRPFQVIQSDITYFRINDQHYYLVFIIDVYTRMVLGYNVSDSLRTESNEKALDMALKEMKYLPGGLIHHSDQGSQYSSTIYTEKLKKHGIQISMGNAAWENAFAERINGIIKNEYLKMWSINSFEELKRYTTKAVNHYNRKRRHRAFKMKYNPVNFYQNHLALRAQERPTVIIYAEGRLNFKGTSSPPEVCPSKDPLAHICPMDYN